MCDLPVIYLSGCAIILEGDPIPREAAKGPNQKWSSSRAAVVFPCVLLCWWRRDPLIDPGSCHAIFWTMRTVTKGCRWAIGAELVETIGME